MTIALQGRTLLVNGEPASKAQLCEEILMRANRTPLVLFESASKDASLSVHSDDLAGSVRLLVGNLEGTGPEILDAYMRIVEVLEDGRNPEVFDSANGHEPASSGAGESEGVSGPCEDRTAVEGEPFVRYYAAPIDLRAGTYAGGRALRSDRSFVDTDVTLVHDHALVGSIAHWDEIVRDVSALFSRMPQIEFAEVSIRSAADAWHIVGLNSSPTFNRAFPFPDKAQRLLKAKVQEKRALSGTGARQRVNHAAFLRLRRRFTRALYPKDMVFYQGLRYPHDVLVDLFSRNGISLPKKLWAYRHGFLSYRLDLYPELGESTWEQYVTDFEYRWLRHINPKYRAWMEDKITIKYVAAVFNRHLPAYYYFISCRAGENRVIPLMDCPHGFAPTVEDVLRLARECGTVALKPDEGSHGEGFYKLSHVDGSYFLNDVSASVERVEEILRDPKNQYLVTEYIDLHPDLKRLYPGAVNSVRITTFKRDGVLPEIGNAYLRIGSSRTGAVDNVVAGGFVAEVDVATGRFGDARTLVDNRLVRTSVHPDTNELMEGVLPHWDMVCGRVLSIAHAIPQLEYMGFDVAITEDGFKLLEVNRYPDYPRISRLTPATTSYLLQKIEDKKRFCDIEHDHSLFELPRRTS